MDNKSLNIFLSYAREDRKSVFNLYNSLLQNGYSPWIDQKDLLPGEDWKLGIEKAIRQSDVILVCLSNKSKNKSGVFQSEMIFALDLMEEKPQGDIFLIPVLLESCEIPDQLRMIQGVYLYESGGLERLLISLKRISRHRKNMSPIREDTSLVLQSIQLENIRCFRRFRLRLDSNDVSKKWIMVLGDNASGKTTLLRSIALGLCNESDAIALIKETPGGFIRNGAKEAYIRLTLRNKNDGTFTVTTKLTRASDASFDVIRQEITPIEGFSWKDIFVCGYGPNRSTQAYTSYESYQASDAVRSLFNYQAPLQNPEVIFLRQEREIRQKLEQIVLNILMLDEQSNEFSSAQNGLGIFGPWGFSPISALSDDYRSTIQWTLDFLSWSIYADRLRDQASIGGILLIDEIEQHLHPRWQRFIAQRLRKQFPDTQIISTTHTPLVASGMADIDDGILMKLDLTETKSIKVQIIERDMIDGKRADQILTSEAFGLYTTRNPGSQEEIDRYAELLGKFKRTRAETHELNQIRGRLQNSLTISENKLDETINREFLNFLKTKIQEIPPEVLELKIQQLLSSISDQGD